MPPCILVRLGSIALVLCAPPAWAGELRVTVRTPAGAPVPNAVVTAYPATGDFKPRPETLVVAQENISFQPYVLIAPLGSTIGFPNRDKVRHHVYSFSPVHRFELKLYGHEEERVEIFDKPGIVPLGCNIHDRMAGFIDVVDTRFAAKSDAQGVATIPGVPGGTLRLKVWHPLAKAAGGTVEASAPGGAATVTLELRTPPPGKQAG